MTDQAKRICKRARDLFKRGQAEFDQSVVIKPILGGLPTKVNTAGALALAAYDLGMMPSILNAFKDGALDLTAFGFSSEVQDRLAYLESLYGSRHLIYEEFPTHQSWVEEILKYADNYIFLE